MGSEKQIDQSEGRLDNLCSKSSLLEALKGIAKGTKGLNANGEEFLTFLNFHGFIADFKETAHQ